MMMISTVFTAIIFLHLSIATANSNKYTSINDPQIPPWLVIKSVNRLPPRMQRQQQPNTPQQQQQPPNNPPQSSPSSQQQQQSSPSPSSQQQQQSSPSPSSPQQQQQQQSPSSPQQQQPNSVAQQPSGGPGAMASGIDFNTQYDKSQSWSLTYANCSGEDHYWCAYHTNQYITWTPNPDGTATPQADCPQIVQAIQGFEARCCLTLQRYGCGGGGGAGGGAPSTGNGIIGDGSVGGGATAEAAAPPATGR